MEDPHRVTAPLERRGDVRTDESAAADEQDAHCAILGHLGGRLLV
jgi:hypothetical protein